MDAVSPTDIAVAVKNCRVLIACVSNNFEQDSHCRDIFLHAKDTMDKELIVVVLGDAIDWQDTDMGIKIGQHEVSLL